MEEYGFSSGLMSRIFRKILPIAPDSNTIEYVLLQKKEAVPFLLSLLDLNTIADSYISQQLVLSIKALCAKVVAFGIDSNIKAKYNSLELTSKPFEDLLEKINNLDGCTDSEGKALMASLDSIILLINQLRKNKNKIGTNFHLTITTTKILEYTFRIKELLDLKINLGSRKHWESMFLKHAEYLKIRDSVRRYIRRNSDLLALVIVEHTSNKGQKYIAENRKEYWSFFYKSLLGGSIISIFALVKLYIDSFELMQFKNALFFSLNYALCFITVKQLGGIIATKQPAMTASTIAKNIDKRGDLQIDSINSIIVLTRKVFRSQFISIIGNFIMAFSLACLSMYILQYFGSDKLSSIVKPRYLIKNVVPSTQLIFFAAIAGIFLALSGLISGYVDNKVVASKIAHRIRYNTLFFKSKRLATYAEKKAGALVGNISLGFLLGSCFLLSNLLPFEVDIRHIAFSSSYVGYSIMSYDYNLDTIILALLGALLIGLINFLVSFSITLYLALKSRGASFKLIPKIVFNILKDFAFNPLYYFYKIE